jgi:hypothetical protein
MLRHAKKSRDLSDKNNVYMFLFIALNICYPKWREVKQLCRARLFKSPIRYISQYFITGNMLKIMTSQGVMHAGNSGLSGHGGKTATWPLS